MSKEHTEIPSADEIRSLQGTLARQQIFDICAEQPTKGVIDDLCTRIQSMLTEGYEFYEGTVVCLNPKQIRAVVQRFKWQGFYVTRPAKAPNHGGSGGFIIRIDWSTVQKVESIEKEGSK